MIRLLATTMVATALVSASAFAQQSPRCPNITIVFDVSGSMLTLTDAAGGGRATRYEVGKRAVAQLLANNDAKTSSKFRYGLELFGLPTPNPEATDSGACGVSPRDCSHSASNPSCLSVQASAESSANINKVLGELQVGGDWLTPTSSAIKVAGTRPDLQDTSRDRYVLLITDGQPNCVSDAVNQTVNAIAALNPASPPPGTEGIKTYVLGFNVPNDLKANLNRMAVAGGTNQLPADQCTGSTNSCYYNATSGAELEAALAAIVEVVGGEFGTLGCDDSCYAHPEDCGPGEMCRNGECAPNPCANVTCNAGEVCVEGACKASCQDVCRAGTPDCNNGTCVAVQECDPSCGVNQVCVGGSCVEDYCRQNLIQCPADYKCEKNACEKRGTPGSSNPGTTPDGGTNSNGQDPGEVALSEGSGCTSGAPGALTLLGVLSALASLALLRRPGSGA